MSTRQITLPIVGMTCASCVAHVEGALNNLAGVEKAIVNLGAAKANVDYDPARISPTQMVAAVADVGYEVGSANVTLNVTGMTCASCVAHVEGGLKGLDGVTKATVNLVLNIAKVEYVPTLVTVAQMKNAIRDVGYDASEKVEGVSAMDREREQRQKEIRRQGTNLAIATPIALVIMAGTFRDILPPDLAVFIPALFAEKWFLGLLTTPIVLGPGRQFFTNSWRGLRHGGAIGRVSGREPASHRPAPSGSHGRGGGPPRAVPGDRRQHPERSHHHRRRWSHPALERIRRAAAGAPGRERARSEPARGLRLGAARSG